MRTALYARYSDGERQNDRSIDDQFDALRRHATVRGWVIIAEFCDRGIPGFALANRPGVQSLLAAADAGAFDLVLTEDEDRLARNQEHLAHIANRLEFAGVGFATLETDQVDDMRVAFKGLMGQRYLKELGKKTARSMRANAERGLATGSRLYGYATQPGGAIAIVEAEAAVIRRIFGDYGSGLNGRDIAAALNSEGVPSPSGRRWNRSTILGSRSRANGILHTELYTGVKVYNRVEMRKDPRTGRRVTRIRPAQEWIRVPAPHLRIVDQADWEAVKGRQRRAAGAPAWTLSHSRKGLFSGLVKCGCCGGGYITFSAKRLRCATRIEQGAEACSNGRTLARGLIEQRVLDGLQKRLLHPDRVAAYVRAYHAAWKTQRAQEANRRAPIERRLGEIARSSARIVDAIGSGSDTPAMRARLVAEEAERVRLAAELEAGAGPEPPIELHPRAAELFAKRIGELRARLDEAGSPGSSPKELLIRDAIRGLIDRIEVMPLSEERAAPVAITLYGRLVDFLQPQAAMAAGCMGVVVAGGGIEPPT